MFVVAFLLRLDKQMFPYRTRILEFDFWTRNGCELSLYLLNSNYADFSFPQALK